MNKLLIVDDSAVLLEIMKNILERMEYIVKTLNTTDNIYNVISVYQPDVLILDVVLDDEDGRDICKRLKNNFATRDICILVFSASRKFLENYKNYGANDVIEKPFSIEDLEQKIKSILALTAEKNNRLILDVIH
jgi:DNA-binding response OmpR family regulator